MKCVGYIRVSTTKQETSGLSLDHQRASIEKWVADRGGVLLDMVEEVQSGKNTKRRPLFRRAVSLASSTGATLVCATMDRMGRDLRVLQLLDDWKVDFAIVNMPSVNRTMLSFMMLMAQHERELIAGRVQAAENRKRMEGRPSGYHPNSQAALRVYGAIGRATQSSEKQAWVDDHILLILAHIREGKSARFVADVLNRAGVKTPRGQVWREQNVRRVLNRNGYREDGSLLI